MLYKAQAANSKLVLFKAKAANLRCVSNMKMSPLTAMLKCPHYEKGHFNNESAGEAEVPSFEDGLR